jgi:hypothetical protein
VRKEEVKKPREELCGSFYDVGSISVYVAGRVKKKKRGIEMDKESSK